MSIYLNANVTIDGNVVINGSTETHNVDHITVKDPLITLGSPSPGNGFDGGLIIEKNINDIVIPTFSGVISAATSTTATIVQSGNFAGWLIKITSGAALGEYKYIISSAANVITTSAWTNLPIGSNYNLFSETHSAMIYRPTTDQFILGTTYNTGTDQVLDLTPKPLLIKNLVQTQQEDIIYVGKHGEDTNSGTSISEALLTFTAAFAKNKFIVCLDEGNYSESVVFSNPVYAPNATITGATGSNLTFYNVGTLVLNGEGFIQNFTTATLSNAKLFFKNGSALICSASSTAIGETLGTITATGDLKISATLITGLISADNCYVSIISSEITSSPLANSNLNGQIYIISGEIADYTFSGTGSVIFADSKKINNHFLNYNNPHQVSINQVSPLTTKGDLIGFSTSTNRFPAGPNNYVLSANSAQTFGLEWIPQSSQPFYSFVLAAGIFDLTIQETTIAHFTWKHSEYNNLTNGRLVFYLTAPATVKLQGLIIYGSVVGSAGYNVLNISLPTNDDDLLLIVSSTTNAKISGATLLFGLISTSFSASTAFDYKTVSGNYNILPTDDYIFCNTSSPVSLTLPSAFKKKYKIIDKGNAAVNNIIIIGAIGKTTISVNYDSVEIISDTINWYST